MLLRLVDFNPLFGADEFQFRFLCDVQTSKCGLSIFIQELPDGFKIDTLIIDTQ